MARRADRRGRIRFDKPDTLPGDAVDVARPDPGGPVAAQIAISALVGQDENNVGAAVAKHGARDARSYPRQKLPPVPAWRQPLVQNYNVTGDPSRVRPF
jgi:hypothetical protein